MTVHGDEAGRGEPVVADRRGVTDKRGVTQQRPVSEEVGMTEEPGVTDEAVATAGPAATEGAGGTEEAGGTRAPAATEEPTATKEPAAGGEPAAGEEPAATDELAAAGAPEAPGTGQPRSGLRNPAGAVRGVGAGTLALEAIVLLLAIVPLTRLGVHAKGAAIGAVLALMVLCVVVAGLLRHRWAWHAGTALQVALFACGLFHVALAVLGVLFGAVWAYVLSVRRSVTG